MKVILLIFFVFIMQYSSFCVAHPITSRNKNTTITVNKEVIELKKKVVELNNKLLILEQKQKAVIVKKKDTELIEFKEQILKKIDIVFELCIIIIAAILFIAVYLLGYKRDVINSLNKDFEKLNDELFFRLDDTHRVRNNLYDFMTKYGSHEIYKVVKDILHKVNCDDMEGAANLLYFLPQYFTLDEDYKNTLRYTLEFFIDNNIYFIQLKKRNKGNEFYRMYLNTIQNLVEKLSELESE